MTFALATPFFVALVLTVALVPLCRLLAHRTGVVAHPRNDRWHRGTIPLLGGVSIGVSLGITTLVTGLAGEAIVPLTAALLIFLTGLVDDFISLKPATKLIAQIALAAALVYFGYQLNWIDSRLGDSALTMLWVVGLTNAFNLLDNMDGLCAGTAFVVAVMLIVGLATGASPDRATTEIAILAALAGAVAGFLVYNFPPASIFMGDSGSLLLGFTLATFTLSHEGVRGSRSDVLSVIAGPVFVLLLPIFDTTLVTVMRLLSGRSPATGGRDHSSHRLVAIGLSERTAVMVLWALAAAGGLIGVTLRNAGDGWSTPAAAMFLLAVCLFAVYLARVRVYDEAAAPGLPSTVTVLTPEFMYKRRVAEVLLDFCLISLAYYGAYQLRFEGDAAADVARKIYERVRTNPTSRVTVREWPLRFTSTTTPETEARLKKELREQSQKGGASPRFSHPTLSLNAHDAPITHSHTQTHSVPFPSHFLTQQALRVATTTRACSRPRRSSTSRGRTARTRTSRQPSSRS